jgi:hypothetical protein
MSLYGEDTCKLLEKDYINETEIQPYRLHTTHNMNNAAALKIARI